MSAEYYDLGTYSRPVTTSVTEAQEWFDRGVVWTYGFNHEEAVACFERALELDPGCAMAAWGVAYALGPNYNKPWEFFDPVDLADTVSRVFEASSRAAGLATTASPVEQALIGALRHRYPEPEAVPDCSVWNRGYAAAMREVHARHPEDLDVCTLFADALMNLTPWELWDQQIGAPAPGSHAVEARQVLDHALALPGGTSHPGLLHMYIHLMEMSAEPEQALPMADLLRDLVPDAGHLQHMPSHLDVLCGSYDRVVSSNTRAIAADEKFVERAGAMNFYTLYRCHDYHFKIYGAMFLGQRAVALATCDLLEKAVPEDLLRVQVPPMADWLEGFLSMRMHVLIRFGMWQDILDATLPDDRDLYCVTTAMLHYAKTVAYAATGRVEEAEVESRSFAAAVGRVSETRTLFNNTCLDILGVAASMLEGELEYRRGNHDAAFAALRRSIALDDNLPYDEPWGWMQPTRHAYGALLMEQGHLEEAEATYRADLGLDSSIPRSHQHPANVWSLHGLHECLVRSSKDEEALIIGQQLKFALARADVPIKASCFCRLATDDQSCACCPPGQCTCH